MLQVRENEILLRKLSGCTARCAYQPKLCLHCFRYICTMLPHDAELTRKQILDTIEKRYWQMPAVSWVIFIINHRLAFHVKNVVGSSCSTGCWENV